PMSVGPSARTTRRSRRARPRAARWSPMRAGSRCRSTGRCRPARSFAWSYAPAAASRIPMLTRELLTRLPKAELHVHLDSALRPETMVELARDAKFALPTTDPDELRTFMVVRNASSLEDYLARFEYTIPLLQTPDGIERVAYEMVEDAARDGL